MRHPFASVQYCSNRLCFDDDTHDESEDVPSSTPSSTENHNRSCTLAVQPRKPQLRPLSQAQEAAAQVVKRSHRLAMLLGGQEPRSALPTYRPGSMLHGCLTILNSTELLAVRVIVREIAQVAPTSADVHMRRYTATSTSVNSLAPDAALRRSSTRTSTRGIQIAILPSLSGSRSGTPFPCVLPLVASARSHPPTMRTCPASPVPSSMCHTT